MEYKKNFGFIFTMMLFTGVTSIGTFQLRLIRFVNNEGFDQTGNCCSNPDSTRCFGPCRTAFRVCLTHYQTTVVDSPSCTFGSTKTPVLGENTFDPASSSFFHSHPINFNFSFRWPVSFSLVIDVLHVNANGSASQIHGRSNKIISRLVKSGETFPVKGGSDSWTRPEPYIHRQSRLYYEYRVVCDDNQYGNDCGTFCRPRDDQFGHYTCNTNGDKVCLPGWTAEDKESYCTKALCPNGCKPQQGTCVEPNVCRCNVGWKGNTCTECETIHDCGHGYCNAPFECICSPGWGGSFCNQDLNFCVHNEPCQNGATCSNTGEGSYTCNCAPGFIGPNCQIEVNECDSSPCQNAAKCVDMKGDYKCICPKGLHGRNCENIRMNCDDDPCMNGGTCIVGGDQHQCNCPPQWSGLNCQKLVKKCRKNICLNNGTCRESSTGISCECKDGFKGTFCKTKIFNINKAESFVYTKSIVKNYTETQIFKLENNHLPANSENDHRSLVSKHWILICFGSVAVVVVLMVSAACLFYHKRKNIQKPKPALQELTCKQEDSRSLDMAVLADHCSPNAETNCDKSFQNPFSSKVRLSTGSFQQQRPILSASLADVDRYVMSERRSSRKSLIATGDGHCGRPYSCHFVQSFPEFVDDDAENAPLRRPCSVSSPIQSHEFTPFKKVQTRKDRPYDRPRSLRHSFSRPPTYEEVCREKIEFVRLQSGNGIAI